MIYSEPIKIIISSNKKKYIIIHENKDSYVYIDNNLYKKISKNLINKEYSIKIFSLI